MSLYAVQDSTGNYWDFDNRRFYSPCNNARRNTTFNLAVADAVAKISGGHVVELAEAPAKVVVSEEEAKMLTEAKTATYPAEYITRHCCLKQGSEDRLMRAYVIGWTVEKPKRWNVKVPLVQAQGGLWFFINSDDKLDATYLQELAKKFTMDEIEENGLQDCEKVDAEENGGLDK